MMATLAQQNLKSSVFWSITSCNPVKVNRCFGGKDHIHLHGQRISQERDQHVLPPSFWSFALLTSRHWRCKWYFPLKHWLTFTWPYSITTQNLELFIMTSVRTPNTTNQLVNRTSQAPTTLPPSQPPTHLLTLLSMVKRIWSKNWVCLKQNDLCKFFIEKVSDIKRDFIRIFGILLCTYVTRV
jgi:hypothetical protein